VSVIDPERTFSLKIEAYLDISPWPDRLHRRAQHIEFQKVVSTGAIIGCISEVHCWIAHGNEPHSSKEEGRA